LAVEGLGGKHGASTRSRSAGGAAPFAAQRSCVTLRRPTLLGTVAEANLPLEPRKPDTLLEGPIPSPALAAFRRMEMGRWIERHAHMLGGEARGDLTSIGVPVPSHDTGRPGHSEVAMVTDIGRAIYFNTVPLWLGNARWHAQATAARGIPEQHVQQSWQTVFKVIGMRLPVPDPGILTQMRHAVIQSRGALTKERSSPRARRLQPSSPRSLPKKGRSRSTNGCEPKASATKRSSAKSSLQRNSRPDASGSSTASASPRSTAAPPSCAS
jgi:hypothetical protein